MQSLGRCAVAPWARGLLVVVLSLPTGAAVRAAPPSQTGAKAPSQAQAKTGASGAKSKLKPDQRAALMLKSDDPTEVGAGLGRLAGIGGPRASRIVAARLKRGLPNKLARIAIDTLVECGDARSATKVLIEYAQHRHPAVRGRAVTALGELKVRSAQRVLVEALDDGDATVRAFAADALVALKARGALKGATELWTAGSPEAGLVVGYLARPADIAKLLKSLHPDNFGSPAGSVARLDTLTPVLEIAVARRDLPRRTRLAILHAVRDTQQPAARALLHGWSQSLPQADGKLRTAAYDAAAEIVGPEPEPAGTDTPPAPASDAKGGK